MRCRTIRTRCTPQVLPLTDCDRRINIRLSTCSSSGGCDPNITKLVIERAGCDEYEEVCKEVESNLHSCFNPCGCNKASTKSIVVEYVLKSKPQITYPLHEITIDNEASFVMDGKLKQFGYGQYKAYLYYGDCPPYEFLIDYSCGTPTFGGITTTKVRNTGDCE